MQNEQSGLPLICATADLLFELESSIHWVQDVMSSEQYTSFACQKMLFHCGQIVHDHRQTECYSYFHSYEGNPDHHDHHQTPWHDQAGSDLNFEV